MWKDQCAGCASFDEQLLMYEEMLKDQVCCASVEREVMTLLYI